MEIFTRYCRYKHITYLYIFIRGALYKACFPNTSQAAKLCIVAQMVEIFAKTGQKSSIEIFFMIFPFINISPLTNKYIINKRPVQYITLCEDQKMQFSDFLQKNIGEVSFYSLAKQTGISLNQIINYSKGKSEPSLGNADKICKALGVKLVLGK